MKFSLLLCLGLLAALVTACVSTVDGRHRSAVPLQKDKIESRYERTMEQVLSAARETLKFNGTLTSEDVVNNVLTAKIDTRSVWVRVDEVEPKVTRIVTQVRTKNGSADIALAAELDKQVALRLRR